MDKKNLINGGICLILAFVMLYVIGSQQKEKMDQYRKDHPELYTASPATSGNVSGNQTVAAPATTTATSAPEATSSQSAQSSAPVVVVPEKPTTPALTPTISNDYIDVKLTEDGGGILTVSLKKYPAHLPQKGEAAADNYMVFNAGASQPVLTLSVAQPAKQDAPATTYWTWNGKSPVQVLGTSNVPPTPLLQRLTYDAKASKPPTTATFRGTTPEGLEVTRTYTIGTNDTDAYDIQHTTTFTNHGDKPFPLQRLFINVGIAPPTPGASSIASYYLNFGYYDGTAASFIGVSDLQARQSALFGLISPRAKPDYLYTSRPGEPDLRWVSVKDQFFTAVLTPESILGSGFFVQDTQVTMDGQPQTSVMGDLELNLGLLPKDKQKTVEFSYYVGPKEYVRLDALGANQDLVMQFGWFGPICKILLLALIAIHTGIEPLSHGWSWGWSIIIFTIIMKALTWPLTGMSVRSAKRMSEIQKPLAALKEKYKDNPQKLQTETIELFKKSKVNPLAGCLPMLIQFPIFIAFNYMLRTASEMRFQGFLWVHDLSAPDAITHIGTFPVNLLPLLMTGMNMLQMRLIPSPTTDSTQRTMMQFMPLIFLAGFYSMPSGMILYWTCQTLFTIVQQRLTKTTPIAPAGTAPTSTALPRPVVKRR